MAWELFAVLEWCLLGVGSEQWFCTHIISVVNGEIIESKFAGSIFFSVMKNEDLLDVSECISVCHYCKFS